ncbi:MAG: hypothetical protein L0215_18205 [Gemmataceae bacterium]|nr:hypothetical protein [Gemmataceae bacterium]
MHRFVALVAVLAFSQTAAAQLPPDKALQTFKVSEGLEITLWAHEPDCINPTCMDIDHKGRVWYCESINYRQKLRGEKKMRVPEGDRIVILEDSDLDGKADKQFVFYQAPEVHCPLGIAVYPYPDGKGQKVYVCQSPNIWVFEDKDGDLKADGPPSVLLKGFQGLDHDHGVHSVLVGPDHRLYFTVGDAGVRDLQSSDGKGRKWTSNSTDCRAGTVWRSDLDGKNLELIAHNFRNNYECCVDSFGTIFLSDNDDDGNQQTRICYVMPGGNYGYHPRGPGQTHWHEEQPGVVPKILRTYFGSPTGICMYEGTLLPKKYWGQILHTDAGPRHLRAYHLTPDGAGYKAVQENMVESSDTWFRPSDVCVAPDGSVFVTDWYDPGVGGHGIGDFTRGRIYRIAPKGHSPRGPTVDVDTDKGLSTALASANLAIRSMALGKCERNPSPKKLRSWEAGEITPVSHPRFMWLTWRIDMKTGPAVPWLDILDEFRHPPKELPPDFLIRIYNDGKALEFAKTPREDFRKAVTVAPITSLREVLLALRDEDPSVVRFHALELARLYDGKDRFYLAAIGIAVGHPGVSKEIDQRRDIILADFEKHFPEWNDKVAGLVWELRPPGMAGMLEKRLAHAKLPAKQKLQVVDILAASSDAKSGLALLNALPGEKSDDVRQDMLRHLRENLGGKWSGLRQGPELKRAIMMLLEDPKRQAEAYALIAAGKEKEFLNHAVKAAMQDKLTDIRREAIRALGAFPETQIAQVLGILVYLQEPPLPDDWKAEAVAALGQHGTQAARERLAEFVESKKMSLPVRQAAVAALSGSREGTQWLLSRVGEKNLATDLESDLSRLLRNSPFADLKKQAQKLLPAPPKLDPKKLPSIPALLARRGNPERGKEVWAKSLKNDAACMKCHVINPTRERGKDNEFGGNVGPELSVIGSKASRENLLDSILYPSKAVADQYVQWVVETNGGVVVNGLLMEETKEALVLRDVNAKDHKIKVKDIASKNKAPTSLMPDNLLLFMSEDDLLDVVEYLYSLKSPALAPLAGRD